MAIHEDDPIIVIGGFGSHWRSYSAFCHLFASMTGRRVFVVTITRLTWFFASYTDFALLVKRTHNAVNYALQQTGAEKVILIGHSAGGLVARAYLCDVLEGLIPVGYSGHNKVSRVVMLGSPLVDAVPTRFTATRLAGWIDQHYPGDFYAPDVEYLAVAGRCIEGNRNGLPLQRSAYHVYQFISGNGAQWGDGIVPISLSIPHGMTHLILDGIGHSPSVGHAWYGSNSTVIGTWWR